MSKGDTYKQVMMFKEGTGAYLIGWIPSAMAKVGRRVTVESYPGVHVITEVYDLIRTEEQLAALRGEQRDVADVLEDHR